MLKTNAWPNLLMNHIKLHRTKIINSIKTRRLKFMWNTQTGTRSECIYETTEKYKKTKEQSRNSKLAMHSREKLKCDI